MQLVFCKLRHCKQVESHSQKGKVKVKLGGYWREKLFSMRETEKPPTPPSSEQLDAVVRLYSKIVDGTILTLTMEGLSEHSRHRRDEVSATRRERRAIAAELRSDRFHKRINKAIQRQLEKKEKSSPPRKILIEVEPPKRRKVRRRSQHIRPTSMVHLPKYDAPIVDRNGRVGVFVSIGYDGAQKNRFGVFSRRIVYALDAAHCEKDSLGNPMVISNLGCDIHEIVMGADLLELAQRESRKDAKVNVNAIIQLPHDVPPEVRFEIVQAISHELFGRHGLPYAAGLHTPDPNGDARNYHAHICAAWRPMERMSPYKWNISEDFRSDLDGDIYWRHARRQVADITTDILASAGVDRRFTHLSNAERGLSHKPQRDLDKRKTRAARAGEYVADNEANKQIIAENNAVVKNIAAKKARILSDTAKMARKAKDRIAVARKIVRMRFRPARSVSVHTKIFTPRILPVNAGKKHSVMATNFAKPAPIKLANSTSGWKLKAAPVKYFSGLPISPKITAEKVLNYNRPARFMAIKPAIMPAVFKPMRVKQVPSKKGDATPDIGRFDKVPIPENTKMFLPKYSSIRPLSKIYIIRTVMKPYTLPAVPRVAQIEVSKASISDVRMRVMPSNILRPDHIPKFKIATVARPAFAGQIASLSPTKPTVARPPITTFTPVDYSKTSGVFERFEPSRRLKSDGFLPVQMKRASMPNRKTTVEIKRVIVPEQSTVNHGVDACLDSGHAVIEAMKAQLAKLERMATTAFQKNDDSGEDTSSSAPQAMVRDASPVDPQNSGQSAASPEATPGKVAVANETTEGAYVRPDEVILDGNPDDGAVPTQELSKIFGTNYDQYQAAIVDVFGLLMKRTDNQIIDDDDAIISLVAKESTHSILTWKGSEELGLVTNLIRQKQKQQSKDYLKKWISAKAIGDQKHLSIAHSAAIQIKKWPIQMPEQERKSLEEDDAQYRSTSARQQHTQENSFGR